MSKRTSVKSSILPAVAELLLGDGTVTKDLSKAIWLRITPLEGNGKTIKVGDVYREESSHAMSFASDAYRFGRYNHPNTDWANGIHVYASVGDNGYAENGALIGEGNDWWFANYIKPNGVLRLEKREKLDPVDHTEELVAQTLARMQELGRDLKKQDAAVAKIKKEEPERAREHFNTIWKHKWGVFYGWAFQIWIAHCRDYAAKFVKTINNKDTVAALKERSKSIEDRIEFREHVAPVLRELRQEAAQTVIEDGTDTPDFDKPKDKPKEEPKTKVVLFQAVDKNGKLSGREINLYDVPVNTGLTGYRKVRNDGVKALPAVYILWDPENQGTVNYVEKFLGLGHLFGFDLALLPETK